MAKFVYKAKKGLEDVIEGVIDANDQQEAVNRLVAQGLFPIMVKEAALPAQSQDKPKTKLVKKIKKRISSEDILNFTQKLTTLVRAKLDLLASLKILYDQTENPSFKEVIAQICESTRAGKTFSESLKCFPKIFSSLFVNIIKSGEVSGHMDFALEQINQFLAQEESLKTKVRVALAYPSLLLLIGVASIYVLMNFVVPKLMPIFANIGKDLPLITKIILSISMFSHKTWILGITLLIFLAFFIYKNKDSEFIKDAIIKIKANLPILKRLYQNQELAHFSRSLGLLLNSGVVALKSLEIAALTVESPKLKKELSKVCEQVAAGESLSKSMGEFTSLPNFFVKMIAVGEESGRLGEVLAEITRSYSQQIEADVAIVSALLEPILILGLGLVLGTIVLAILLPTFQITQFAR